MRSAKELVARLRNLARPEGEITPGGTRLSMLLLAAREAADYIERTAAPVDGLNEDDAADIQQGRPYQDVLAAKRTAPPDDALVRYDMQVDDGRVRAPMREDGGWVRYEDAAAAIASARAVPPADGLPEFETTAEERQAYFDKNRDPAFRGTFLFKALRDLDKAIAFAASETKRADEALAADLVHQQSAAGEIASLNELIRAGRAVCDREAAARRVAEALSRTIREELARQVHEKHAAEDRAEQAEAREATLRAALEAIDVDVKALRAAASRGPVSSREVFSLTDPIADKIARAALATTSTGEGS